MLQGDCGGNSGPFRIRRLVPNLSDTASKYSLENIVLLTPLWFEGFVIATPCNYMSLLANNTAIYVHYQHVVKSALAEDGTRNAIKRMLLAA